MLTRTQCPTNKVLNKVLNKRERKRATSAPSNFSISELMQQWSGKNTPGIDLKAETDRFLDFHRSKGNQFKDWTAAWRNWMRRAVDFQKQRSEPQSVVPDDPYEVATR